LFFIFSIWSNFSNSELDIVVFGLSFSIAFDFLLFSFSNFDSLSWRNVIRSSNSLHFVCNWLHFSSDCKNFSFIVWFSWIKHSNLFLTSFLSIINLSFFISSKLLVLFLISVLIILEESNLSISSEEVKYPLFSPTLFSEESIIQLEFSDPIKFIVIGSQLWIYYFIKHYF